jgi:hypothetical protein
MNAEQLRTLIIQPTLEYIGLDSIAAQKLLLGTCAQETLMGTYVKQIPNGPALGPYGMEPATHDYLYNDYLFRFSELGRKVKYLISQRGQYGDKHQELIFNWAYATAMCRVKYLTAPELIPDTNNIEDLADYWKKYYNTPEGAGTVQDFIENYERYVL